MGRKRKYQDGRPPGRGRGVYVSTETDEGLRILGVSASGMLRVSVAAAACDGALAPEVAALRAHESAVAARAAERLATAKPLETVEAPKP